MAYELIIGDRSYSSWSLRAWLVLEATGAEYSTRTVDFATASVAEQLGGLGAGKVPALVLPNQTFVWDSLAIAEELASRHPEAGLWPADPTLRALARSAVAEMHSGFPDLREDCPMNLRTAYDGYAVSDAVRGDVARIEDLWRQLQTEATNRGAEGPWLTGAYSIVDAFYAPVAARFATYRLIEGDAADRYVAQTLADPAFRRWRAMGLARGQTLPWYDRETPKAPWAGPETWPAEATDDSDAINDTCPYSGKPVTHFARIKGHVVGFCNAFCRDKTVADPWAFPEVRTLLGG